MKQFVAIFVLALVAAALADDAHHNASAKKLKAAHEACNEDPALKIEKADFEGGKKPENLGAHNLCVSKRLGWQNADGTVNAEAIRAQGTEHGLEAAKIDEFITKCATAQETPEATASHMMHCIVEGARKHATH